MIFALVLGAILNIENFQASAMIDNVHPIFIAFSFFFLSLRQSCSSSVSRTQMHNVSWCWRGRHERRGNRKSCTR